MLFCRPDSLFLTISTKTRDVRQTDVSTSLMLGDDSLSAFGRNRRGWTEFDRLNVVTDLLIDITLRSIVRGSFINVVDIDKPIVIPIDVSKNCLIGAK